MALQRVMVTDFSFGEVSKRYAGRMSTELRTKSLEYIKGFRLGADAGVSRRHGTIATDREHQISVTEEPDSIDVLYEDAKLPSFIVWRDGSDRVLGLIYANSSGTKRLAWNVLNDDTSNFFIDDDASVEPGVPMRTTGTFYDPETDTDYVVVWTDSDSFYFPADSPTGAIERKDQIDLAVIYQNRLISVNRSTGELWMSKVMDLFDFVDQGPQSIFYEVAGTGSASSGALTLTGSGTQFTVDFDDGDDIRVGDGATSDRRTIDEVTDDTTLTVTEAFDETHSGENLYLVTDGIADPRPLYALPDWADAETATWLVARQSVYIGTDHGEHEVFSNYPFFDRAAGGLMIRRITGIGSENAAFFGSGLAVQSFANAMVVGYGGQGFEYNVAGVSSRIDNNRLLTVQTVEFGTHRYLLVLDVDGVLWAYVSNPSAQSDGWVELAHNIGWVFVHKKDVYVAVLRDFDVGGNGWSLEVQPLDILEHPGTRTRRQTAMFFANDAHGEQGGYLVYDGSTLTGDKLQASTTVDIYTISLEDKHSTYQGEADTDSDGDLDLTNAALETLIGYTSGEAYIFAHTKDLYPEGEIRTLPLGGVIGSRCRIARVILQVYESSGARVRVNDGTWEEYTTDDIESGTWAIPVEHNQEEEPRVTVEAVDARPLNIYQILVEVDIGG